MEEPKGKSYEGPSGIGRDSIWLTAEDLIEGKDQTVLIEDVILYPKVSFMGGRTRLNMLGLKFKGKERVLGLNATNRKSLNKAFGNVVRAWKGQTITLYVAETQMAGETVKCVRIRNAKARAVSAAEDVLNDTPDTAEEMQAAEPAVAANGHTNGVDRAGHLEAEGRRVMKEIEESGVSIDEAQATYSETMRKVAERWDAAHPAA
jgi:hypothetical protein